MKTLILTVLFAGTAAAWQPTDKPAAAPKPAAKPEASQPKDPKAEAPKAEKPKADPYTLGTCPISGGKLGSMGDPVVKVYDGREVRFCCNSCPPKFEKDLAKSMAALDAAIIKDQGPIYPLKTSVVTGKDLPAKPFEFVHGNRLIRLGAEAEKADFLKDTAKHLKTLDEAVIAAQGKDYPLTTCPISGGKLGSMGAPVDMVIGGRLVRLCCKDCRKDVEKDPVKTLAFIEAARKDAKKPAK